MIRHHARTESTKGQAVLILNEHEFLLDDGILILHFEYVSQQGYETTPLEEEEFQEKRDSHDISASESDQWHPVGEDDDSLPEWAKDLL